VGIFNKNNHGHSTLTFNDERRIFEGNALDQPPLRLDKKIDNLKRIELIIPVSSWMILLMLKFNWLPN